MSRAYKNFWSLNTDEAVAAGILRDATDKNVEVLMPLNAQMKGIDLVLYNRITRKTLTIQVKGSRAYEPRKSERKSYGAGSAGWFFFDKSVIENARADYFLFLVYVIEEDGGNGRRFIVPHTLTIKTTVLKKIVNNNAIKSNRYNFIFWVNPEKKSAFDIYQFKFDLSVYLDEHGFSKLAYK